MYCRIDWIINTSNMLWFGSSWKIFIWWQHETIKNTEFNMSAIVTNSIRNRGFMQLSANSFDTLTGPRRDLALALTRGSDCSSFIAVCIHPQHSLIPKINAVPNQSTWITQLYTGGPWCYCGSIQSRCSSELYHLLLTMCQSSVDCSLC